MKLSNSKTKIQPTKKNQRVAVLLVDDVTGTNGEMDYSHLIPSYAAMMMREEMRKLQSCIEAFDGTQEELSQAKERNQALAKLLAEILKEHREV